MTEKFWNYAALLFINSTYLMHHATEITSTVETSYTKTSKTARLKHHTSEADEDRNADTTYRHFTRNAHKSSLGKTKNNLGPPAINEPNLQELRETPRSNAKS